MAHNLPSRHQLYKHFLSEALFDPIFKYCSKHNQPIAKRVNKNYVIRNVKILLLDIRESVKVLFFVCSFLKTSNISLNPSKH